MLGRWLRKFIWKPFEIACRANPLIAIKITTTEPVLGVKCLKFHNLPIKFLSWFAGGYDYAVVYIIDNEIVFDSGFAWGQKSLNAYLEKEGMKKSIHTVINSHFHEDHIGNNNLFVKECDAEIFAHEKGLLDVNFVKDREFFRHFLFGNYVPSKVGKIGVAYQTLTRKFEVLETPGHTPDHICLYDPINKILLSGDLFINENLSCQLIEVDGPSWIASLHKCVEIEIEILLDGHGAIISGHELVKERLSNKIKYLETIKSRVEQLASTEKDIQVITAKVFDDCDFVNQLSLGEGWMSAITLGAFARSHLVKSFIKIS
ncbi:MAG: hypothetical protein COA79_21980 [Planctomycetota bacterium]|nr:MAG: hypothetical protein COA79_21980 [Planctomycetota bacterium]